MEFLFVVIVFACLTVGFTSETASDRSALSRRRERTEFCSGFTVDGGTLYQYIRRVRYRAFEEDFISKTKDAWSEIFGADYLSELKRRGKDFDIWKARLLMAAEGVMYKADASYGIGSFGVYDAETKLRICRAMEQKLRERGRDVRFVIEPPPSFRKLKIKHPPAQGTARWLSYCSCVIETPSSINRKSVRMWEDDTTVSAVSLRAET